jgi:uncharacterized protein
MASPTIAPENPRAFLLQYPVGAYFVLTFALSWLGALAVASPHLASPGPMPMLTGILMFPAMLLGPSVVGLLLTRIVDGRTGVRELFVRMSLGRAAPLWCATLLIPPVLICTVLVVLKVFISPVYAPNLFLFGAWFGVPAGLLEEIGWIGYAFPKMQANIAPLTASITLGVLWSTWHLPVINYLGTATPHGEYWFPFFLAFATAMTAMRVLICWIYSNTKSVLLAQLMHISSTGSLVIFSPSRVTSRQEVVWYFLYAGLLWSIVAIVAKIYGKSLALDKT